MAAVACLGYGAAASRLLRELFGGVGDQDFRSGAEVCVAGERCLSELVCVEAKGLLFDMDGVLISSIGSVVRCWRRWAEIYHVPNAATYTVPHGVRAIDIVKQ